MGFHSLYLLPSLMEKIHVGLRNQAGGVCTLDNFEEEVTGVVGIIDVIEVAPMLIGDEVAAHVTALPLKGLGRYGSDRR
jgi:hypothetical protein